MFDSVRLLDQRDAQTVERFLAPHSAKAYYLRANALNSGLVNEGRISQGDYVGAFQGDDLVGVQALFNGHSALWVFATDPACIEGMSAVLKEHWRLSPRPIRRIMGLRDLAWASCKAWGITPDLLHQPNPEWLFQLDLAQMKDPPGFAEDKRVLRLSQDQDEELLIGWRVAYYIEALCESPQDPSLRDHAKKEFERHVGKNWYVLESEGQAVSMGGVHRALPDMVFIGPMWTPPELRNRGHARSLLAKALRLAESQGVREAALFAERPDAIACYEKLGFRKTADWLMASPILPILPEHLEGSKPCTP
ncbi:MAG: GNAT family N-acetyltransferase [Alphaproteobacteria bacterium]|nr:MAG: GNAT family N-acetyltransferase [Alphaproteobacteria bacterium]